MSTVTTTITRTRQTTNNNNTKTSTANASLSSLKPVTYAELQQHSGGYGRAWTAINGKVYDVTDFQKEHPGGEIIRYAAGRDGTCLVESYHPGSSSARIQSALSTKCTLIGALVDGPEGTPTMTFTPDARFFDTCRQRVETFIKERGLDRRQFDTVMTFESMGTLALYLIASYFTSFHGSYLWCLFLGVLTGRMGFLMHSGNHCSTHRHPLVNLFCGYFMDLIGSSHVIWGYEHQVAHHCDPNEHHRDNDCEIGNPLVRMHPKIPTNPWQRIQHITVPLGMTIGLLKWYMGDFGHFRRGAVGNCPMAITTKDWVEMLIFKSAWMILHVLIPAYYFGWFYACFSAFLFMGIGGHYLENVFIVNHIQNGCVPPVTMHWANKQVMATCNWGSGSFWCNVFSGGLNHQIEHHLFPSLPVYFYPLISPIVSQTCKDYGLPYYNFPTLSSAWMAMWRYLRALGQPDFVPADYACIDKTQ